MVKRRNQNRFVLFLGFSSGGLIHFKYVLLNV